jgi:hypothetical protein
VTAQPTPASSDSVTGVVEAVSQNGSGIRVAGEWLNFSRRYPDAGRPVRGQRVSAQVERTERGAWIVALDVLDGGAIQFPQRRAGGRPHSDPREIRRLACLKAAAWFASGKCAADADIRSRDVLAIADAWLAWVEQKGGQPNRSAHS